MKFSCLKSELVQVLQIAGRSIASKPQTPILSGIYLHADQDILEVQATDYEIGVILHLKAEVEHPGEIVVSGKYFYDVVRTLPDEEVVIEYDRSTEIVKICSGKSTFTLLSMKAVDFPKIHQMKEGKSFTVSSVVLKELIRRTIFSCATEESKPLFMGALLEVEGQKVRMVATNSHRLSFDEGKIENELEGICQYVIPKRILEEIQHILSSEIPENVEITCTHSEMSFNMERIYMTTRLIEGNYPEYRRAVPPEFSKRITLSTSAFLSAVSRVGLIARSSAYNTIKLMFNMGEVHIYSDNPVVGKAEETMRAEIEGDDIGIAFNASYLIDVLKILNSESFILELNDSLKPALIREPDNEDFLYVITPVRTKN
ncbi:MAG: DNA polymerase III subunit beta [Lachnospiraceae bacterium]|nr:DNA polymerase III subunit beta [Lachnospiraceae bacterium]